MRIRRAIAACFVAAAAWTATTGGSASATPTPVSTAYWVKFGLAVPLVPKGGLFVANDPTSVLDPTNPVGKEIPVPIPAPQIPGVSRADLIGPLAIGALRITGVGANDDVTLTLDVALGSVVLPPSVATILACPLAGPWQAPQPGPASLPGEGDIATAPGYECSIGSVGMVTPGNGSISWLLPASDQSTPGELDIALVPNPAALPVPYEVIFDPPTAHSLMASTGPAYTGPTLAPTTTVAPGTASLGSSIGPSFPGIGSVGTTGLGISPLGTQGSPPTIAFASPAPQLAASRSPIDDRSHRIMAVVLLLIIAAAWWFAGSQPGRAPKLLGALGGPAPKAGPKAPPSGGVGRFQRPRTRAARRL